LSACAEGFQDRILGTTDQLSGSRRPRKNIVPLQPLGGGVSERETVQAASRLCDRRVAEQLGVLPCYAHTRAVAT